MKQIRKKVIHFYLVSSHMRLYLPKDHIKAPFPKSFWLLSMDFIYKLHGASMMFHVGFLAMSNVSSFS